MFNYLISSTYYSVINITRKFISLIDNKLLSLIPLTTLNTNIEYTLNLQTNILVCGLFGYPKAELEKLPYWSTLTKSGIYSKFITPKISPVNNFIDRACELFCALNGINLKYIRKRSDTNKVIDFRLPKLKTLINNLDELSEYIWVELPYRKNTKLIPSHCNWLNFDLNCKPNDQNMINFICHSAGGLTLMVMFDLLDKRYFDEIDYIDDNGTKILGKKYSEIWNKHINRIVLISCPVYGALDNFKYLLSIDKYTDIFKYVIISVGINGLRLLQYIPLSIRSKIYDPMLDIYTNTTSFNLFNISNFIETSQLYYMNSGYVYDKYHIVELLKKSNTEIHVVVTYFSEKVNNIQLIKSSGSSILVPINLIFLNKSSQLSDGVVPVNTMFGCESIKLINNDLNLKIIRDEDIFNKFYDKSTESSININNCIDDSIYPKLNIYGYIIDHIAVIGFNNIYTDKYIWNKIINILNHKTNYTPES